MSFKLVVDSSCELDREFVEKYNVEVIPFGVQVGDYFVEDDENCNQLELLEKIANSAECGKSSCPSPERFVEAYKTEVERIYVVTLSSRLSGCYNSANLARDLYIEKNGDKKICLVDSKSASCGESQIAMKIAQMEDEGLEYDVIVKKIMAYRDEMKTFFVLNNLDTLRKNGRLTGIKSVVASTLNIKPVMSALDGDIIQLGQAIGIKKALGKMVDTIVKNVANTAEKSLIISNCNCLERANMVKEMFESKAKFASIKIINTRGLSSLYANDGGIIVTV